MILENNNILTHSSLDGTLQAKTLVIAIPRHSCPYKLGARRITKGTIKEQMESYCQQNNLREK